MAIKVIQHWEDLDQFEVDVLDKFGNPFIHNDKQWRMVLRPASSDQVQAAIKQNAAEDSNWRARLPKAQRDQADIPEEMALRHGRRLIAASHIAWIDPAIEGDETVDFSSQDFADFLEGHPWYVGQWQRAWLDIKNSTRLKGEQPKKTSSTGAKNK